MSVVGHRRRRYPPSSPMKQAVGNQPTPHLTHHPENRPGPATAPGLSFLGLAAETPAFVCPIGSDAARRNSRHHQRMKNQATAARLDVLEAAVLALAESLPPQYATATRAGFLQKIEDLPAPVAPAADIAAARTLAAVLAALLR